MAVRALRILAAAMPSPRPRPLLCICAWGATGAFALELGAGGRAASCFEPAPKVRTVVDSTGAGDTFIAASLGAIALGSTTQEALRRGCAVAARKVGQEGYDGLAAAW